ncbi:IclR family transcriptional regulator [Nocardioides sp.]|uniref:IclR family transcriptional regulator n=1 Tax=Nocardioides sp. TaxID=35761 RepID=UPI002EDAA791
MTTATDPTTEQGPRLQSVLTALDLLDCFVDSEELGVTDLARRLGVAKSTAHRLVSTLAARGFVERVPGTGHYRLGLHLWELGQLVQDRTPLRHLALPILEEVRLTTGQTAHLSIADGPDVVFVERLQALSGISLLGARRRRMPLHTTSAGKVLAAFNPAVSRARIAAGFPPMTGETIGSAEEWEAALAEVRRRGLAVTDSENVAGLASVAAPVFDGGGLAVAAISVAGPRDAIIGHLDRTSRVVLVATARLSRLLGG